MVSGSLAIIYTACEIIVIVVAATTFAFGIATKSDGATYIVSATAASTTSSWQIQTMYDWI